jgi:hypothetical protein
MAPPHVPDRSRIPRRRRAGELDTLDLVRAVAEATEDDGEVVATVLHLLRSGSVRLTGTFRGERYSRARPAASAARVPARAARQCERREGGQ